MSPTTQNDNTKKVLRIALIGIRPADQVILKGYLRLLMRLEADLEWVSANHEAVDLLMINSEFQRAESIQRLLATHAQSSVLYIARSESDNGFLLGKLLTLPIKDLEPLNQWLYTNLHLLMGKTPPKTNNQTNTSSQPQVPQKRLSLDDVINSKQNQSQTLTTQQPTNSNLTADTNHQTQMDKTKDVAVAMAKILSRLNKKEDQLFSLNEKNGTFLAYIQPKKQRIWTLKPLTEVGEWTLNVANPATLNDNEAEDLVQFFWKFGLQNTKYLEPLINPTKQYRISSWVKPDNNAQQNHVLKIQCVLEARLATLADIIQLTGVNEKTAHTILIALVMSGVMNNHVYETLSQTVLEFSNTTTESVSHSQAMPHTTSMPIKQSTTTLQQEIKAEQPQSVQKDQNNGMKGFLSRLRSKLGI